MVRVISISEMLPSFNGEKLMLLASDWYEPDGISFYEEYHAAQKYRAGTGSPKRHRTYTDEEEKALRMQGNTERQEPLHKNDGLYAPGSIERAKNRKSNGKRRRRRKEQ